METTDEKFKKGKKQLATQMQLIAQATEYLKSLKPESLTKTDSIMRYLVEETLQTNLEIAELAESSARMGDDDEMTPEAYRAHVARLTELEKRHKALQEHLTGVHRLH